MHRCHAPSSRRSFATHHYTQIQKSQKGSLLHLAIKFNTKTAIPLKITIRTSNLCMPGSPNAVIAWSIYKRSDTCPSSPWTKNMLTVAWEIPNFLAIKASSALILMIFLYHNLQMTTKSKPWMTLSDQHFLKLILHMPKCQSQHITARVICSKRLDATFVISYGRNSRKHCQWMHYLCSE